MLLDVAADDLESAADSLAKVDAIWARKFGSWHPGVCQFVFCDGSTRLIRVTLDVENLRRLAVRNDGDPVSIPD